MPKRKSTLSRKSKRARLLFKEREEETVEQHQARLQGSQERMSTTRLAETTQQRQIRLHDQKNRASAARQAESAQQTQTRLHDKKYIYAARQAKTLQQQQTIHHANGVRTRQYAEQANARPRLAEIPQMCLYEETSLANAHHVQDAVLSSQLDGQVISEKITVQTLNNQEEDIDDWQLMVTQDIAGEMVNPQDKNGNTTNELQINISPDPVEGLFLRAFQDNFENLNDEETRDIHVQDELYNRQILAETDSTTLLVSERDERAGPSNIQDQPENRYQALCVQDLDTSSESERDQQQKQTNEVNLPRRSNRLAVLPQQPQVIRRPHRVRIYDIARQTNVDYFNELEILSKFPQHYGGSLYDNFCPHCKAYHWNNESGNICCKNGKVSLPLLQNPPEATQGLYETNSFLDKLVWYNNALALTSLGCKPFNPPGFNPIYKIQGKIYHQIGSLLPPVGAGPKFAQIYMYDTEHEIQNRLGNTNLDEETMTMLQENLHQFNSYVKSFKSASELVASDVNLVLHHKKALRPSEAHCRTYNLPHYSEVAALVTGEPAGDRDLILSARDGSLKRISALHRSYDPLQYVLMFPYGEDGWELDMYRSNNRNKISPMDFYSYRLQVRKDDFNTVMRCRRLMQTYAVDMWCKIEAARLHWAKTHQKEIKAEKYSGLLDAIAQNDLQNAGRKIILPPTIYGSPRFYQKCFQNAMALVRHFGKPDYFITMTCNPKWKEIQQGLFPGETVKDRPDLAARVFKMKYDSLMNDLLKECVLGKVNAHTATIEWQKRSLTHVHILLIMKDLDKPRTPEMIDKVVSAEIPDKNNNPKLYDIITSNNIHGPACGTINKKSPCLEVKDKKYQCTKNFPKSFSNATIVREDSYPEYRRRSPEQGGHTHIKKVIDEEFVTDNSWVVPYNPTLSLRYDCHINCEIVHSVAAVKYLYKYITKGNDRVIMELGADGQPREVVVHDEIENFVNARYVSASEAIWKMNGFPIHSRKPTVEKLPCHLEDEQITIIPHGAQADQIQAPVTKLTAFFELNKEDALARKTLYCDIPKFFTWQKGTKEPYKPPFWQRRKRGQLDGNHDISTDAIGRIPIITLNPYQSELYYLRMLLHHKTGATCHNDLKKVQIENEDIICGTFQETCQKLGLLEDDTEMSKAMEEVSSVRCGNNLRDFFCSLLTLCQPSDPHKFWNDWKLELCRDKMVSSRLTEPTSLMINEVLFFIKNRLDKVGLTMEKFQMPQPDMSVIEAAEEAQIIQEELPFDMEYLKKFVQEKYPTLNEEQKYAFDQVMESVNTEAGKLFCLNAGGGTGKTYSVNLLLAKVRSQGKIALATALSGIAATLLDMGRTLHSRCKVPIHIKENSTCNMTRRDATGKLFQKAHLLIIDEVSMGDKLVFECIDRSLQYIRENDQPFGGMTVLFAGDWRQILPVVPRGSRAQVVHATLKESYIWKSVKH